VGHHLIGPRPYTGNNLRTNRAQSQEQGRLRTIVFKAEHRARLIVACRGRHTHRRDPALPKSMKFSGTSAFALECSQAASVQSASGRELALSASAAVGTGEAYLLGRIRAHELLSRAPTDSPDKRYDDCGEPFLALDALIALGDRITAVDRQTLAARLRRCRCNGAWDRSQSGTHLPPPRQKKWHNRRSQAHRSAGCGTGPSTAPAPPLVSKIKAKMSTAQP
jgi:hypothetical protein